MPELADDFCQLLREVRNGSEDAVWALINEYGDAVREAVRNRLNQELRSKFDSMDFVQLVWGSVFRARDKLERFERPEELVGYLVVLAQRKVGMERRRRLRSLRHDVAREQPLEEVLRKRGEPAGPQPEPIDTVIAHERWTRLLEGQPRHCRLMIELRLKGYDNCEIARELGIHESTVRIFLKRLLARVAP